MYCLKKIHKVVDHVKTQKMLWQETTNQLCSRNLINFHQLFETEITLTVYVT